MNIYTQPLSNLAEYQKLKAQILEKKASPVITGIAPIHKSGLISLAFEEFSRPILIITSDSAEAERLAADLSEMTHDALLVPKRDIMLYKTEGFSLEFEGQRIEALYTLCKRRPKIVVAPIESVIEYTIPKSELAERAFTIKEGTEIQLSELRSRLVKCGYSSSDEIDGQGQFAIRGGIADIFPFSDKEPTRIEFFGDEVDTISSFDLFTQRRTKRKKEITIIPTKELIITNEEEFISRIEEISSKSRNETFKKSVEEDKEAITQGTGLKGADRYLSIFFNKRTTLIDYLENPIIFISEQRNIADRLKGFYHRLNEESLSLIEEGCLTKRLADFCISEGEFYGLIKERKAVYLDSFFGASYKTPVYEPIMINAGRISRWNGSLKQLIDDLKPVTENKFSGAVLVSNKKSGKILEEDLRREGISAIYSENPDGLSEGTVTITTGRLSEGYEYRSIKTLLITHGQNYSSKKPKLRQSKDANRISSFEELKKGDYVVHTSHGIGVFDGIQSIVSDGVEKDYIKIKYAKSDVLYLPVTQLDLVSKYIGAKDDGKVKLNSLGSSVWQKSKDRVRKALKDMAKELIALYSKRSALKGYAFAQDTEFQHDFEGRFEFEETDDQLRCSDEIKKDMQRQTPMDRLLCGDVGFGKTEVAMRAMFKAITEGKQVALLVPTTILAFQHYNTIIRRMEGFPVTVKELSRFVTQSERTKIIKELKKGTIDVVVGTHSLISDSVRFKDLGLLIIDEEQRFGVAQKEKIKEKYPQVDVLTLSATPIPRTLNMALTGIRDMSIIEEAPGDRRPVQTYVMEYDFGIIKDAIEREVGRNGQVYYLYNNIERIEAEAIKLRESIPGIRVGVAHGRMSEEQLSRVWKNLVNHEIDLLCCTTIIETGVDVQNVNTLIIKNSDRMGLSQLHQIRGRVGRSSRRAYAYFTFERGKVISETANERLSAIREYTEFGAGFKIAIRDLEIRGAGNLLGGEQHGNMEAVGYELYLKLLDEAVRKEKGETVAEDKECLIDLQIDAHIPESYLDSVTQRLMLYRKIAEIETEEEKMDLIDEMIDRFGEPPEAVIGLTDIALLRGRAKKLCIFEIKETAGSVLYYPEVLDMAVLEKFIKSLQGRVLVSAGSKPYFSVKKLKNQKAPDNIRETLDCLQNVSNVV